MFGQFALYEPTIMIYTAQSNLEFKNLYSAYLEKHEAKMQLFLVNLMDDHQFLDKNQVRGGVYNEAGEVALLFLNANPFKLQLFGIKNSLPVNQELIAYLQKYSIEITGILGNKEDTDFFLSINYEEMCPGLKMDIMVLNKLNKIEVKGKIINPTQEDFEFIKEGYVLFTKEVLGKEIDDSIVEAKVRQYLNSPHFFIYQNAEGEKTSFLNLVKRGTHGLTISAVYTFMKYRNRGYAKAMVNLACEYGLKRADYLSLFVDQNNPISNKVYLDNGFQVLCEALEYHLKA